MRLDTSIFLIICVGLTFAQDGVMFGADEQQPQEQKGYCDDNYQFACASGECIAKYDRCDGISQCFDGSDEVGCPEGGFYQSEQQRPSEEHMGPKVELKPKTQNTTDTTPKHKAVNGVSLKLIAAGLFGILALSALIHFLLKRRRARLAANRNFRKGEALIDEEDDLLISQMYA